MKPAEKNLEKLVKRVLRGDEIDPAEMFFHWDGLGHSGDLAVIHLLNRQKGWDAFFQWGIRNEGIRTRLEQLIHSAGVTREALESAKAAGLKMPEENSPAVKALVLEEAVNSSGKEQARVAIPLLKSDPDLIPGLMLLLENSGNETAASFCLALLDQKFPRETDQWIRKTLYALKQKGISLERSSVAAIRLDREIFLFGENKLPLWQPVLYFRAHSQFSDAGDLYIFRIVEGFECAEPEQIRNLNLTRASMAELAARYSRQIEDQIRVKIDFREVEEDHARYLISHSIELLKEKPGVQHLRDFLKFAGEDPRSPILLEPILEEADPSFFLNSYFGNWMLNPHEIQPLIDELNNLEKGAIILVGAPLIERQQKAVRSFVTEYFDSTKRSVWSYALAKAAYYLKPSNPGVASGAYTTSLQLQDQAVPVDDIPPIWLLVEKTLEMVKAGEKAREEEEKKSSLIMSPQEFERQRRK